MASQIVVLSGPVAAGKSTLATALGERWGVVRLKTQDLLIALTGAELDRAALQQAGERLDRETGGAWVVEGLTRRLGELPDDARVLVDSVRLVAQVEAIQRAYGEQAVIMSPQTRST